MNRVPFYYEFLETLCPVKFVLLLLWFDFVLYSGCIFFQGLIYSAMR